MQDYSLPAYDAEILTSERSLSDYFESAVKAYNGDPKKVSNWMMNDILRTINDRGITAAELKLTPAYLADLITWWIPARSTLPRRNHCLKKLESSGKSPAAIVEAEGLGLVSDDAAIRAACEEVVAENPGEVASYKAGKTTLMGWFVGQVMRKMRGKADPQIAGKILAEILQS